MSSSSSSDWTITLVAAVTGRSECIPVPSSTLIAEIISWAKALFGLDNDDLVLFRDGKPLLHTTVSLEAAGCQNGDLLAVQTRKSQSSQPAAPQQPAASGGLDFSNLLAAGGASSGSSGGNNLGSLASSASQPNGQLPAPVYWNGMDVNDAMHYNPHPHAFVTLLQSKEHLLKELNYHDPKLASQLRNKPLDQAVQFWRNHLVESGIKNAMRITESGRKESDMVRQLASNPDDAEAKEYFAAKERRSKVHEQYTQMMNEYPEALGQVLMLYVQAKINDHPIQAFCDSGAQTTIMSLRVAKECGLDDYIDTRFHGIAKGVGTGKIVGRIHMVQLQIGGMYFPCSVTVMDDAGSGSEMPFLFGLDMMKRHTCQIDLEKGVLKFRLAPGEYMEAPFLHEKDLDQAQGGTKGFSADTANQKLLDAMEEQHKKREKDSGPNGDDDHDADMLS
ncbi:hypothetical protein MPSEU_000443900 [Mayamaea pseudoterrestris]|nr:hypothetical protein MPSEU_000443900 [Mayamaea pseudoterrestris]